jgi:Leucine-rich repeat (LRR) protein
LHLRNTKLESLPSSLGGLKQLRHIDLRGTRLTSLPDCLLSLPRIEKIDLRWVDTVELSDWIQDLEPSGCVVYSFCPSQAAVFCQGTLLLQRAYAEWKSEAKTPSRQKKEKEL